MTGVRAGFGEGRLTMQCLRRLTLLACSLAVCSAAMWSTAPAAQQNRSGTSREAFFRCQDASGQTHYGDAIPAACRGLDTEVLNARGMVLRVIEGERTRAARLEREAAERALQREREQRRQRDHMLLETYLSVEDIERLRDQRLELLVSQYKLTEQNIANLRERQSRLEAQVARFKPYSDRPNAPPLPDHLAEEIVNTVNSLQVYQRTLAENREEQEEIRATFDADIQRFKELKGIE